MIRTTLLVMAVLLLAVAPALAKPDFSGEWKMNAEKSDFGPMPPPEKMVQKVDHKDPKLAVVSSQTGAQGELTLDQKYTTDGKESLNKFRDNDLKTVVTWDGDSLVFNSKVNFNGNDVGIDDKWALSEDGKVLTVTRHVTAPQGEFDAKIVLDKQ
jgi:hypothetical protein